MGKSNTENTLYIQWVSPPENTVIIYIYQIKLNVYIYLHISKKRTDCCKAKIFFQKSAKSVKCTSRKQEGFQGYTVYIIPKEEIWKELLYI